MPTSQVLLSGLGYFHENKNILAKIINAYIVACRKEKDIKLFEELCINFMNDTHADGYDAIAELQSIFQDYGPKLAILNEITETMRNQDDVIEF